MAKSTARDEKILKQTMWYENCKYEKDAHNNFNQWIKDKQDKSFNDQNYDDND